MTAAPSAGGLADRECAVVDDASHQASGSPNVLRLAAPEVPLSQVARRTCRLIRCGASWTCRRHTPTRMAVSARGRQRRGTTTWCVVGILRITRPRCSPNPVMATSWTPFRGLQICAVGGPCKRYNTSPRGRSARIVRPPPRSEVGHRGVEQMRGGGVIARCGETCFGVLREVGVLGGAGVVDQLLNEL
jgi:hypothetical protein